MSGPQRDRGSIEQPCDSYCVKVYAGLDPRTDRRLYLTGSATNLREAERIRTRLVADADAKRASRMALRGSQSVSGTIASPGLQHHGPEMM
jgi:hypothetical protein